jgi:RHS repeat-associated protein
MRPNASCASLPVGRESNDRPPPEPLPLRPRIDEFLAGENFGGRQYPGVDEYDLSWAATDHLGSVRQLVNDSEQVVEHREYNSFGQITALFDQAGAPKNVEAIDSVFAFAGREWDNDAGAYYNRARWFDPRIGRFLSEDPLGFEGGDTNLYRYANNDPLNNFDPSGNSWLSKAVRKLVKKVKRTIDFVEFVVNNPDDFVKNLDEIGKGLIKDPMFWVTVASFVIGPIFATNVTWGAFQYNVGVGGGGLNWLKFGADTFRGLTGGGFNLGMPSFSVSTPVFNLQTTLFQSPAQYVYAAQNGAAEMSRQMRQDTGNIPAQYSDDELTMEALARSIEENGLPYVPREISPEMQQFSDMFAAPIDSYYSHPSNGTLGGWPDRNWSTTSMDWGALTDPIVDDVYRSTSLIASAP